MARQRDKKKQHRLAGRERKRVARLQKSIHNRKTSLRDPYIPKELHRVHAGPRVNGPSGRKVWTPHPDSVVEVGGDDERRIIAVLSRDVGPMLQDIAPQLEELTGAEFVGRAASKGREPRGASIILTTSKSSSGPHADGEDTMLLNVSGERRVWYAPAGALSRGTKPSSGMKGQPMFLPPDCDPTCNDVVSGVKWEEPVTLQAGDAMWLGRGWWHCVQAEPEGVAISIETKSGSVRGDAPRVFEHAASHKQSGRAGRSVSRCQGWGSAMSVLKLWSVALAAWDVA